MIALDTSVLVAMALGEPEADGFICAIVRQEALVGTPTLLATHMVLASRIGDAAAAAFVQAMVTRPSIRWLSPSGCRRSPPPPSTASARGGIRRA